MQYLIFDTETSGFPMKKVGPDHPHQPHMLQLAWIRFEINKLGIYEILESRADYVKVAPDTYITPGASAAHGITLAKLQKEGKPLQEVVGFYQQALQQAEGRLIAHNFDFDKQIINTACIRAGNKDYAVQQHFCTMKATTNICQLPGRYGNYKWPNLGEAFKHFTGRELVGAHDSLVDVKAVFEIYRALPDEVQKEWWQDA